MRSPSIRRGSLASGICTRLICGGPSAVRTPYPVMPAAVSPAKIAAPRASSSRRPGSWSAAPAQPASEPGASDGAGGRRSAAPPAPTVGAAPARQPARAADRGARAAAGSDRGGAAPAGRPASAAPARAARPAGRTSARARGSPGQASQEHHVPGAEHGRRARAAPAPAPPRRRPRRHRPGGWCPGPAASTGKGGSAPTMSASVASEAEDQRTSRASSAARERGQYVHCGAGRQRCLAIMAGDAVDQETGHREHLGQPLAVPRRPARRPAPSRRVRAGASVSSRSRRRPAPPRSSATVSDIAQPPIADIGRAGCRKDGSSMPCPARLPHIAARQRSASSSSSAPARSAPAQVGLLGWRTGSCGPARRR